MKFRKKWMYLLALSAAMSPAGAAAQERNDWYFGMSMMMGTYSLEDGIEVDADTLDFRLGTMINDYVGFEGRFGLGFNDENTSGCQYVDGELVCANTNLKVKQYFGAYARGYLTAEGMFRPYAVIGYTTGRSTIALNTTAIAATNETVSGLSYGLGLNVGSGPASFALEYTSLFDTDGHSIDGFGIGFLMHF